MIRKIFASLALLLMPLLASGAVTEIRKDFPAQTSNLSANRARSGRQLYHLVSANIAEVSSTANPMINLVGFGPLNSGVTVISNVTSLPQQAVAAFVPSCDTQGRGLIFFGTGNGVNPVWGSSPTYSTEVDVLQF